MALTEEQLQDKAEAAGVFAANAEAEEIIATDVSGQFFLSDEEGFASLEKKRGGGDLVEVSPPEPETPEE